MRTHQRFTGIALTVAALALVGCGAEDEPDEAAPDTTEEADPDAADETEPDAEEDAEPAAWEPTENVEFIIPFGPGGGFDAYSRQVVESAQQFMPDGVRIDVSNVEGGGGGVGAETLRRAEPDGHTVGLVYDVGLAVTQTLDDDAPISLTEDFAYIAGITEEPYVLFATTDSGITSIEDLEARDEPVLFGSLGASSPMFVVSVITSEVLGYETQHVTAYGGAGDLLSGATRGDFEVSALEVSSIAQYVEAGDLVPLLVLGEDAAEPFPDTPTITDTEGFDTPVLSMRPIGAPSGVDQAVVDYWEDVFLRAMESEGLLAWSEESGRDVDPSDAARTQERVVGAINLMESFQDEIRAQFELVGE